MQAKVYFLNVLFLLVGIYTPACFSQIFSDYLGESRQEIIKIFEPTNEIGLFNLVAKIDFGKKLRYLDVEQQKRDTNNTYLFKKLYEDKKLPDFFGTICFQFDSIQICTSIITLQPAYYLYYQMNYYNSCCDKIGDLAWTSYYGTTEIALREDDCMEVKYTLAISTIKQPTSVYVTNEFDYFEQHLGFLGKSKDEINHSYKAEEGNLDKKRIKVYHKLYERSLSFYLDSNDTCRYISLDQNIVYLPKYVTYFNKNALLKDENYWLDTIKHIKIELSIQSSNYFTIKYTSFNLPKQVDSIGYTKEDYDYFNGHTYFLGKTRREIVDSFQKITMDTTLYKSTNEKTRYMYAYYTKNPFDAHIYRVFYFNFDENNTCYSIAFIQDIWEIDQFNNYFYTVGYVIKPNCWTFKNQAIDVCLEMYPYFRFALIYTIAPPKTKSEKRM